MFDLNSIDFQYDVLDCGLQDKRNGKTIAIFDARELSEQEIRSGYVSGANIYALTQSRLIATTTDIQFNLPANAYNVIIDGTVYSVLAIRTWKYKRVGEDLFNGNKEIILELG